MPAKIQEKHQQLLASIPLFAELSPEQLAKVAALAEVRSFGARDVVVTQGDPARALYAIVRGRLKVSSCGPDGRDVVLGIMAEGEVFGEVALLDGGLRSATMGGGVAAASILRLRCSAISSTAWTTQRSSLVRVGRRSIRPRTV